MNYDPIETAKANWVEAIVEAERKHYEDFDKARQEFWDDPANKGLSFPTCIHGSSNWTDYDNICGACEDGYTYFIEEREREDARLTVEYAYKVKDWRRDRMKEFIESMDDGRKGKGAYQNVVEAMAYWVMEPIQQLSHFIR